MRRAIAVRWCVAWPNAVLGTSGLGLANLVGATWSAYPATGGFSRSAVNAETGAVSGERLWLVDSSNWHGEHCLLPAGQHWAIHCARPGPPLRLGLRSNVYLRFRLDASAQRYCRL